MRCLSRNKRSLYYCLYQSTTPKTDASGNETGETIITYAAPVKLMANVSIAHGEAQTEQFGTNLDYDKVIVTDDVSCPISETTVLFVDKAPAFDSSNRPLYDYIVTRVAKSLNSGISYAIRKVR